MKATTVLLVDDHAIVREGLRLLVEAAGDMQVAGEAENGREAVREAARLQPDVVLLDLAMPILNGLEAARQIGRVARAAKVLVLSSYSDSQHVRQAIEAGVAGYVMKESATSDLLDAVRAARGGEAYFSAPVLKEAREQQSIMGGSGAVPSGMTLTSRQVEVLQLIAEGYSTKQIAAELCLSKKSIEKHRQDLMNKLNLHGAAVLTSYAVASGIVDSGRIPDSFPGLPSPPRQSRRKHNDLAVMPLATVSPASCLTPQSHVSSAL